MSFCTACGTGLSAGARFCPSCGGALEAPAQPKPVDVLAPVSANGAVTDASEVGQAAAAVAAPPSVGAHAGAAPSASSGVTSGGAPAATGPGAAATRAALAFSQLPPAQSSAAAKSALLALASVTGTLLVVVALAAGIFAPQGHHGSPADWLRTAVLLLGLGAHAPAELHVSGSVGEGSVAAASAVASVSFTPLIVTALIGFAAFWFGRRAERRLPSTDVRALSTAAVLTGGIFAVAAALLALLAGGALGYGVGDSLGSDVATVSLGANAWVVLVGGFVLAAAATLLGRLVAFARARAVSVGALASAHLRVWVEDLRAAKNLMIGAAAVTIVAVVAALGWAGIHAAFSSDASSGSAADSGSSSDGAKGVVGTLLAGALMLPNLLVSTVGFALGGSLGFSGTGSARSGMLDAASWAQHLDKGVGLFNGGVPAAMYLILVPMLLMALTMGMRASLQRAPGEPYGPHVWRTTALFAAAWAVLAFLVSVSVNVSANATALSQSGDLAGGAQVGLGLASTLIAAVLWAVVGTLGGALTVRFVAAALPRQMCRLGGRGLDADWRLLLADAVLVRGGKVPAGLAGAADQIRQGQRPGARPLDVRPERDRLVAVGAGSMLLLAVAATIGYQVVEDHVYGPNVVVGDYYAALRARNVPAALSLLDSSTSKDLDKTLLTSAALTGVPSQVSIGAVTVQDDTATVSVKQSVGGSSADATYTLKREGSAFGVFDQWRLESPFTQVNISLDGGQDASTLTVNGVPATLGAHPVFPGVYTVALKASGLYLATDTEVSASGEGSQDATLTSSISPDVQVAADQAVHRFLDACAASRDVAPAGCPFSYYDSTVTAVHWSITSYPNVTADVAQDGTISVSSTDTSGTAHLSAVSSDFLGGTSPVSDDETFDVSGTLNWAGGDPATATFSSN